MRYHHHHHHVLLLVWISLTLSLSPFIYHPSLPVGLLDYIMWPYRAFVDKFQLVVKHLCVHRRTSRLSSSLLLHQYPACLVGLIWMVLEIGGRLLYSCCFVTCCFQNLFNIACSILAQYPSSFFSIRKVRVHVKRLDDDVYTTEWY